MVVVESLVDGGQNSLSHLLSAIQVMITVREHFGLDDWDQSVGLADGSITSLQEKKNYLIQFKEASNECGNYQDIGVLEDGLVRWRIFSDLEDAAPLGKLASILLVLGATAVQIIKTLSCALVFRTKQVDNTLVNLDTRVDSTALENINESNSSTSLLRDSIHFD